MSYTPCASETTLRPRSMSTWLVASTVTPGSTAPVASLTTPVMALWALAVAGQTVTHARPTTNPKATVRIDSSFLELLQDSLVSVELATLLCESDRVVPLERGRIPQHKRTAESWFQRAPWFETDIAGRATPTLPLRRLQRRGTARCYA